jgi:carbonic anhydrase
VSSPTQRSKRLMEERGYVVAIVEYWHAFARQRRDLFGVFDLLGIGPDGTLAVQTTSASNVSARLKKLADAEAVATARKAGWQLEVHGWRKDVKTGRWVCRVVDIS